jgi:DNA invertase Pin-like site-specific DNA recombinase
MPKKEQVTKLLQRNTDGLTITEIAKALKISRNTVPVILAELKGEKKIRIRPVGKAKLHYWKEKK